MGTETSKAYTTGSVLSKDGTTIGYRQLGKGPALLLVHGGMMASQNFMELAMALSDTFTVYIPDRRGRGMSGPHGKNYNLAKECEDIEAVLQKTNAEFVFGLSSGAIVVLQSAFLFSSIKKAVVYEPPIPVNGINPAAWTERYENDLAKNDLAGAMVSVIKGTADSWDIGRLPRFLLKPLMKMAIRSEAKEKHDAEHVALQSLIPTIRFDTKLVKEMEGKITRYASLKTKVLLMGGSKSIVYLKTALDALNKILPHAKRVTLKGTGHTAADNGGKPGLVAAELKKFFSA